MIKIEIQESCEGYIWMSNQPTPNVIDNKPFSIELDESKNPFIVEGHLYIKDKKSYSIKYVDGKYYIKEYVLDSLSDNFNEKAYIPHLPNNNIGKRKICFRQYWKEERDELCEKMLVLIPSEYVFVGFK